MILKGLTAGAADPDLVAFEQAFDVDHVIDFVCRFRRRLRIRTHGRWRHRPRSRSRIRKGPLCRQLSGAQSLRTIDVFEGSWGSLGSPGGISGVLGGSRGGLWGFLGGPWGSRVPVGGPWGFRRAFWASPASFQKCPFSFFWEVNLLTASSETAFFEIDRLRGDEVWALCCATLLSFFEACFLRNSEVNML